MSFGGSGSGRSSFGSQKKDRKKKQEFHRHKLKLTEEEFVDLDQLKNKVAVSLDHLGHQTFSLEPGGYSFANWITSFNLLLDDFEQKASPETLPKEYFDARQRLTQELLAPVDTSDIDSEVTTIEAEAGLLREKISNIGQTSHAGLVKEQSQAASNIERLKKDQKRLDADIADAKAALDEEKKKDARKSFFSKLRSGSNSPVKLAQSKLDGLETSRNELKRDLKQFEETSAKAQSEIKSIDEELATMREQLEALRQKQGELESRKMERLQLSEKREETTKTLAALISSLKLGAKTPADHNDSTAEPSV